MNFKLYSSPVVLSGLIISVLIVLFSSKVMAQPQLLGEIWDSNGPLEFADVILTDLDSVMIKNSSTDDKGAFSMNARPGSYLLQIRMISYQTMWTEVINVRRGKNNIPRIYLNPDDNILEEVVVQGEQNEMELKLDKRVYNVEKDLSNAGGTASDILETLPSVTMDVEGNVSLRGSENVRILINGKPSGLLGNENQGLRQLQASMIERVEVITNPSARYEAEGEAGIINIVLKKKSQRGTNGSIDITGGYPAQAGIGINLNHRREKFNIYTNLGANYRNSPGRGTANTRIFGADTTLFTTDRDRERTRTSYMGQLGTDYYINSSTKLTLEGTYSWNDGENTSDNTYADKTGTGEVLGISKREEVEAEQSQRFEGKLSLNKTFTSDEHFLDISIGRQIHFDDELSDITESIIQGIGEELTQQVENREDQARNLLQVDFVYPFGNDQKIEAGWMSSFRLVNNDFLVETLLPDGSWEAFDFFDNEMEYVENIHAAYFIYAQELDKWSYQLGLRNEYSDISTTLVRSDETNPREYNNLFPSAHFSYKLDKKNQFQLSYSKRISRPRFRYLLPFYGFSDDRNLWRGNPNLDPEYSHNIDLGYVRYFDKGSLLTSLYYRYKTDLIQRITFVNDSANVDELITEVLPVNLGTQNAFGVEISANYKFTSWFNGNLNINAYQAATRGNYEGQDFDADILTMSSRASLNFKLPNQWDLQTSANYMAPRNTPQGTREGVFAWDAGISKQFWNNRGRLTINVRDILNSRIWASTSEGENFYRESTFQRRIRSFNVSLNYLINQDRKRSRRGNRGGGGMDSGGEGM